MVVTLKNVELISELQLHDMELLDIKISYFNHSVEIFLRPPQGNDHTLMFNRIQSFSIEAFEPWGEGIYLNKIDVKTPCQDVFADNVVAEEAFLIEILLNSGDKIKILSSEMHFE
jgi:hypothetical protein